jgi:hypothetical protein
MRHTSFVLAGLAAAFALTSTDAGAQRAGRRPVATAAPSTFFEVTPYAGYMVFGDFLSGPLGTSLSNAPAPVFGAQIGMKLAPNISLIGNLAAASSDIKVGIPVLGGLSVAHNAMVFYDAGLQLDIPVQTAYGTTFSPFLQAGAGAMHYDISQSLVNVSATNFAWNAGVGADISVGRNVGLRLMAKDYIGKFDFQEATSFDINAATTNNIAFSAGLRVSF